jgi:hypothetical protein
MTVVRDGDNGRLPVTCSIPGGFTAQLSPSEPHTRLADWTAAAGRASENHALLEESGQFAAAIVTPKGQHSPAGRGFLVRYGHCGQW